MVSVRSLGRGRERMEGMKDGPTPGARVPQRAQSTGLRTEGQPPSRGLGGGQGQMATPSQRVDSTGDVT